jgi:uncharacterized protein
VRLEEDILHVRVSAPPVNGAANDALVALLADRLGVGKRAVQIVSGASSREKQLLFDGLDDADLRARIVQALASK